MGYSQIRHKKSASEALFPFRPAASDNNQSTAFGRPLAGVLLAAGVGTALQADLLTVAGGGGVALGWDGLGGADVGFDSDFLGHGELRVEIG